MRPSVLARMTLEVQVFEAIGYKRETKSISIEIEIKKMIE